jgi:DNA gyrase subunit A
MCALLPLSRKATNFHLIFVTEQGIVKRTPADQFGTQRAGGVNAINLRSGDRLIDVHLAESNPDLLLISRDGRAIRFETSDVPEMGRTAQGVRAMKLAAGDKIVGSVLVLREAAVCAISDKGLGRRVPLADFSVQKRDGRGVVGLRTDPRSGILVGALEVLEGDELMLLGMDGGVTRIQADDVPEGSCGEPLSQIGNVPSSMRAAGLARAADRASTSESDQLAEDLPELEGAVESASPPSSANGDGDGDGEIASVDQFDLL